MPENPNASCGNPSESNASSNAPDPAHEQELRIRRAFREGIPFLLATICVYVGGRILWEHWGTSLSPTGTELFIDVGAAVIIYLAFSSGGLIFLSMACPTSETPKFRNRFSRAVTALALIYPALHVGGNFCHLCDAGSKLIESAAMVGTPLFVGSLAFFVKRRLLGILLAISFIVIVWLLHRPYLDWAHGN